MPKQLILGGTPQPSEKGIGAIERGGGIGLNRVRTISAGNRVIVITTIDKVRILTGNNRIGTRIAINRVLAIPTRDRIAVHAAVNTVRTFPTINNIGTRTPENGIRTIAARDRIRTRTTVNNIPVLTRINGIVSRTPVYIVVAIRTKDRIGPGTARDRIAIGAAVAAPDRKVVLLEGDGSGMYTVQSLWTMARENLDITTIIFSNRSYKILRGELSNVGVQNPGPRAIDMLSLERPDLGWVHMARGMGVDGEQVTDCEGLMRAMESGLHTDVPYLIDLVM